VEDAADEVRAVVEEFLLATCRPDAPRQDMPRRGGSGLQTARAGLVARLANTSYFSSGSAAADEQANSALRTAPLSARNYLLLACALEATAAKPGNVHPGASFADLTYNDLLHSAEAISGILQHAAALGVGGSVLAAVRAMRAAADTNAYLGTILLVAPLVCVPAGTPLESGIRELLPTLDASHTRAVYEAIRLARPGGLGASDRGDVHAEPPGEPLVTVMAWAADRDLVARQYVNGFETVFAEVADPLARLIEEHVPILDAIVRVYVVLLAAHGDSLIARKCGAEISDEARTRAAGVVRAGGVGSSEYRDALADFDAWLRADGNRRNPGTTADLIAAGLYALLRSGRLDIADAMRAVAAADPVDVVSSFIERSIP
jgi:triphosphoribosyl-dephospho-CoA synthase